MKNKKVSITAFVLLAGFMPALEASMGSFLRSLSNAVKGRIGVVSVASKTVASVPLSARIKHGAKRAVQVHLGLAALTGAVVLDEYRRCMPTVPEGFALVDPSSKDPDITIEWSSNTLELPADKIIRDDIEAIIRSCGYKAHYKIMVVDRPNIKALVRAVQQIEGKKQYDLVLEKKYVQGLRDYVGTRNDVKKGMFLGKVTFQDCMKLEAAQETVERLYALQKQTIFHEMGHILWGHLEQNKKMLLIESVSPVVFFIRPQEDQAERFSYAQMDTLDLEYAHRVYQEPAREVEKKNVNRSSGKKIEDFFNKTHPDERDMVAMIQKELDSRAKKYSAGPVSASLAVMAAENRVRAKQLWR